MFMCGPKTLISWLSVTLALLTLAPAVQAKHGDALPTSQLLVDLARDHLLRHANEATPADLAYAETLLEAAQRLDPASVDAARGRFELATARGDADATRAALDDLIKVHPEDADAWLRWIELGVQASQSYEAQRAWLEGQLARATTPEIRALVHTELARRAWLRLDRGECARQLKLAQDACPRCVEPALMALRTVAADSDTLARLQPALRAVAANPLRDDVLWSIGAMLDHLGLSTDAYDFYIAARTGRLRTTGVGELTPEQWSVLAANAFVRGDEDACVFFARQAAELSEASRLPMMELLWYQRRLGRPDEARAAESLLDAWYEKLTNRRAAAPIEFAEAAWYALRFRDDAPRALQLINRAIKERRPSPFAQRVLGFSLAANGDTDAAIAALERVADMDAWAALRLLRLRGTATAPTVAGERATINPESIPAAGTLREFAVSQGMAPTTQPAATQQARALLADFPRQALKFAEDPSRVLAIGLDVEDPNPTPGEPWWATFEIRNNGMHAVALGPTGVAQPMFSVTLRLEGVQRHFWPNYLTVRLNEGVLLRPGESLKKRVTLDVGPVRRIIRAAPQHVQHTTIQAVFDPVFYSDGAVNPGPAGQFGEFCSVSRSPAPVTSTAFHAAFQSLRLPTSLSAMRTIDAFAQLEGERQRAALGRLRYKPSEIPHERIRGALIDGLRRGGWELKARGLISLDVAGFDQQLWDAVRACTTDDHWLCRMMALRLTLRQRDAGLALAKQLAAEDADPLVRKFAAACVERFGESDVESGAEE